MELYLDGGPGEGLFLLGVRADMARPDVNAAFPEFPGDHGYQTVLPEVARDGRDHTLTAVARDSGGGEDAVLANSPVAFRAGLNANPPAEPDPPPDDHLPEGFVDVARPDGVVAGWALDRDVVDRPLEVHFYLDGPAFAGGTFVGSTRTGLPRPDVNQVIGHPGDHGWQFRLPAEHHDGREHPLWVYAFNAGHPGNANLSRSPITFTPGGGR